MQHVAHRGSDPTPPRPRRMVRPADRDFGVPNAAPNAGPPAEQVAGHLTKRERAIMAALLAAILPDGTVTMTSRRDLKASADTMQQMWMNGWVNGAGSPDARGTGNTPDSSWWWLTTKGEAIARAAAGREG